MGDGSLMCGPLSSRASKSAFWAFQIAHQLHLRSDIPAKLIARVRRRRRVRCTSNLHVARLVQDGADLLPYRAKDLLYKCHLDARPHNHKNLPPLLLQQEEQG